VAGVNEENGDQPAGAGEEGDYCRHVEAYLCRKNDGHLIRIAGPAFARVCGWAAQGIPLNVVFQGIDRHFERYYARGPRRRPVQIDFCENDVLDVFDEWRRAVGVWTGGPSARPPTDAGSLRASGPEAEGGRREAAEGGEDGDERTHVTSRRRASLPSHLERVIVRLTTLRAGGRLTPQTDSIVAAAIRDLDAARGGAAHLRGNARDALMARLRALDIDLVAAVCESIGAPAWQAIEREARAELAPFKAAMAEEAYQRAVVASATRLLRERAGLPVVEYEE
jgi:hypothetical protein